MYHDKTDTAKQQVMKDKAFNKWMAYLLIRSSNQSKYGNLMNGFISQFSMGNNQYPSNIRSATDILSNHKFDRRKLAKDKPKKDWKSTKEDNKTVSTVTNMSKTSFAQANKQNYTCFCCGKKGHISPDCPKKNSTPKEDWALKKAKLHMQAKQDEEELEEQESNNNTSTASKCTKRVRWSAYLIQDGASMYFNHQ